MSALPTQVGALAQRSIMRTARQPASAIPPLIFPVALMLLNSGGLHASTRAAGFPDRLVPRLRARRAVHPGRAVLDDERRHRPRPRHPDRVLLAALADSRARRGAARRPLAGIVVLGVLQAVFYIACGLLLGVRLRRRRGRDRACSSSTRRSSRSGSARSGRSSRCAPARARRSRVSSRCSSSSSSSPR